MSLPRLGKTAAHRCILMYFAFFHASGGSGKPMAPVRIPSNGQGVQHTPGGGTPMSTPPSAQGMTAQLPFVDGGPEGEAWLCQVYSALAILVLRLSDIFQVQHHLCSQHCEQIKQMLWTCGPFAGLHDRFTPAYSEGALPSISSGLAHSGRQHSQQH